MKFSALITAGFVVFTFISAAHAKEWYDSYEDGKKAIGKNNCAEGIKEINEALKKNPKPDLKARAYGTMTTEYIPHFYLAKCAFERGDFAATEMYLSEAQKVDMYSSSKAAEFRTMKKAVEEQLAKGTQKPPSNQQANQQNTNRPPKQQQQQTTQPTQAELQRQKEAQQAALISKTLDEARTNFNSGNYDGARSAANRVLALDRNNREAQKILSQVSSKEDSEMAARAKQQKIADVKRALARGDFQSAESMVFQLRSEYPGDNSIESLAQDIQSKKIAQMQTMKEADARALYERQVITTYYEGKYEVAVQMAEIAIAQHPNSWRLYFYKGCAQAALGLMNESRRDTLLGQARESFRKARGVVGDVSQPPQISPKIWDVYKSS